MNESNILIDVKHVQLNVPVEIRFNQLCKLAEDNGCSLLLQVLCMREFGHANFNSLTLDQREVLISASELAVYDMALQRRRLGK